MRVSLRITGAISLLLPQLGERVPQPVLVALDSTLQLRNLPRHLLEDSLVPSPFTFQNQDLEAIVISRHFSLEPLDDLPEGIGVKPFALRTIPFVRVLELLMRLKNGAPEGDAGSGTKLPSLAMDLLTFVPESGLPLTWYANSSLPRRSHHSR